MLFDEIEKAHPDVMDLLLQILEEGRLSDAFGRKIDFRHAIIIMTSNLGADLIRRTTEVGFHAHPGQALDYNIIREKIEGAMKKHFKPEFINRLDGTVVFHPLSEASLEEIITLELEKVKRRLADKHIEIDITHEALVLLVKRGYQPEMGARPLRRALEEFVEDPIAEKMLTHIGIPKHYLIKVEGDGFVFEELDNLAHAGG